MSGDQLAILESCEPKFDKVPYLQNTIRDAMAVRKLFLIDQQRDLNRAFPSPPRTLLTPDEEKTVHESQTCDKELINPFLIPLNSEKCSQPNPGLFGALDICLGVPDTCLDPNLIQEMPPKWEETRIPTKLGLNLQPSPTGNSEEE